MSFNFSSFVDDLVPDHVSSTYPELVDFIKVYALYLEKVNQSGFYLNQLDHQRDIDLIENELLNELQNEIGSPIPRTFAADPQLFYRHLVEFYRSRGTPESIKAFFKLIYNEEVEISFPKDDMLIPSDGKWSERKDGIIADKTKYASSYTWTMTTATDTLFEADDAGFMPRFDDDVVFVNDVYIDTYVQSEVLMNDDHYMSKLVFETPLAIGDVVEVYKRGVFESVDSFVSDKRYVQDSYFYQKFSYVLKTGKNIDEWRNAFTRLIHPAGFIFFGEILIFIQVLLKGMPKVQPGYQLDGLPFAINIEVFKDITDKDLITFITKALVHARASNRMGAWDHFDNIKFKNHWSIKEYSNITFVDVINKTIGTHIGSMNGNHFGGFDVSSNPTWVSYIASMTPSATGSLSGGSSGSTSTVAISGGSSSTTPSTGAIISGGSSTP